MKTYEDLEDIKDTIINELTEKGINSDLKFRNGGRVVHRIVSKDELLEEIEKKIGIDITNYNSPIYIRDIPSVEKDLNHIQFDMENADLSICDPFPNGFQYIQIDCGGDWEIPIIIYIYHDGNNLRGYIPKVGNSYNCKLKAAIGNAADCGEDDYDDIKYVIKQLIDKKTFNSLDEDDFEELWDTVWEYTEANDELCLEDFKHRLEFK